MSDSNNIHDLLDHLFRNESGKMVSALTKVLGFQNLELAQDIAQEALTSAIGTWKPGSVPDNPSAWLHRVARNKAIDLLRREKRFKEIAPEYDYILRSDFALSSALHQVFLEDEITDSQLRMMFACCHPSITTSSQVALILKTLGGLSNEEIARSFLSNEETIAKRIYRAKEKFRLEKIELNIPQGAELPSRLDAVLKSLYLLFSEGYNSANPDFIIREDLCQEAMRLCLLLVDHPQTSLPTTKALMALMCFQASRLKTRTNENGQIVLLQYQDRSKWFRPLIAKGHYFLKHSAEPFQISAYHLEASIASIHADAANFDSTDWKKIYMLYQQLIRFQPNPIVAMNKAIAAGYAIGPEQAMTELQQIEGLESNTIYMLALADTFRDLRQKVDAELYYYKALKSVQSSTEKKLIEEKLESLNAKSHPKQDGS